MVKCAILAFYHRLFGTLRWVRFFCYSCVIVIICAYIAYVVTLLIFCIPKPGHDWDSALVQRCTEAIPATLIMGVCNVIIDIVIFTIPFFIISKLSINRQKKIALGGVFLIGLL